jgi:endoglucanase Acf2
MTMTSLHAIGVALLLGLGVATTAPAQAVKAGAGNYFLAPKGGDPAMPAAPLRTPEMLQRAAPTNQWYSTLIFNAKPEVIFVQPLSVKATPAGLELALPSKQVRPTERRDVEIHYPHTDPLVVSPAAFAPGPARLAKQSDWAIDIAMAQGADQFTATVAHGSPYVSFAISRGDARVRLPFAGERISAADARVLALNLKGKTYAVFGPTGVAWEQAGPGEWLAHLPAGSGYVSAAALPDAKAETLALFTRHAYAFIQDTRVSWLYQPERSQVESTFTVSTRVMEGPDNGPLLGLYPHQWFNNAAVQPRLGGAYDSVRGPIRLLAAAEFKTQRAYNGFVPYWPGLKDSPRQGELNEVIDKDLREARRMMLQEGDDAYWQGKGLQRTLMLLDVVEQQGDLKARDKLLDMMKKRVEEWFSGESRKTYFVHDKSLGAVASYPENAFFTVRQINDHHFTYGYWVRVMAELALRDPAWASQQQWGGMVDLLVADIATAERGRADFPFLRNFDAYEGHSWASGIDLGDLGNNQESSSEAINAWAGLILWGEVTGNTALRDLGVFLYATEADAIDHYWFDVHGLVFPPEYKNAEVSQVFGGAYKHNTWWTDEPRQIKGINLLPITSASLYLGRSPAYVQRNLGTLPGETAVYEARNAKPKNPPPADVWQDIFAKYQALADPAKALTQWNRWGSFELGDSRTHGLHWMLSLQAMGLPDFETTANTPLFSVFKRADGRKTYLAFNATKTPLTVRFSDGHTLLVPPGTLGQGQ